LRLNLWGVLFQYYTDVPGFRLLFDQAWFLVWLHWFPSLVSVMCSDALVEIQ